MALPLWIRWPKFETRSTADFPLPPLQKTAKPKVEESPWVASAGPDTAGVAVRAGHVHGVAAAPHPAPGIAGRRADGLRFFFSWLLWETCFYFSAYCGLVGNAH